MRVTSTGSQMILCSLPDGHGDPAYESSHSLSAAPSSLRLLQAVAGVGPGNSLADKVQLAQTYYEVRDVQATCAVLIDFGNEVRAQRGKKIPTDVADDLTADAQAIMEAIGCE